MLPDRIAKIAAVVAAVAAGCSTGSQRASDAASSSPDWAAEQDAGSDAEPSASCNAGQRRCAAAPAGKVSLALQVCESADGRSQWSAPRSCGDGQLCHDGRCQPSCQGKPCECRSVAPTVVDDITARGGELGSPSLDVDLFGAVHIAYQDLLAGTLRYATNPEGKGWQSATVDQGDVGRDASIKLDSAGRPHIAYRDHANGWLKYATDTGAAGGWETAVIDGVPSAGTSSALLFDFSGVPHIFHRKDGAKLAHARLDRGVWTSTVIGEASDLAASIDLNGRFHVAAAVGSVVRHYVASGDSWIYDTLETATAVGVPANGLVMGVDPTAKVHLVHGRGEVFHTTDSSGTWSTTPLGFSAHGTSLSLDLDRQGYVHIGYAPRTADFALAYATNRSGVWHSKVVDQTAVSAVKTAMRVGPQGAVHLAYNYGGVLKYTAVCP